MFSHTLNFSRALAIAVALGVMGISSARADGASLPPLQLKESLSLRLTPTPAASAVPIAAPTESNFDVNLMLTDALALIGVRYRWGGETPQTGFDCSGFVMHVFREGLGLYLPRTAREQSEAGEPVTRKELKPGDLVFFNTMRRAFSHVGIYLGDNLFVHAPHTGARVRVESLTKRYWAKRFNGARRIAVQ